MGRSCGSGSSRPSGSRWTGSSTGPWTPSTAGSRCWCRPPPARARRSSPTMPRPGPWSWGARRSTPRRSRPCPTRSSPSCPSATGTTGSGLLTGDVSHQAHAPIVVMTTEVLRNMLFARSSVLDGLEVVVLDEVHYLQDPYRGSVWEEVLVLTPPDVSFVSLSATVSNAADFGAWLTSVRGTDPGHRRDPPPGHPPPPLRRGRAGPGRAHRAPAAPRTGKANPDGAGPRRPAAPQPPPPAPGAPAGRGGRVPGRGGHAARHHLHLLPGGL